MFILIDKNLGSYEKRYQVIDNYYLYYSEDSLIIQTTAHIVVFCGYIYLRNNFINLYQDDFKISSSLLTADDVLQLYLQYQEDFLTKVDGAFCGLIISLTGDKIKDIFAFTDFLSKKSLYYYHEKYLGITNDITLFRSSTNRKDTYEQFLVHQVLLGSSFNKLTQIKGLIKLYGGTYLKYQRQLEIQRYFYIEKELRQLNKLKYKDVVNNQRNLIINTLKKYYDQDYPIIMCDVSGGIDSSIVAGVLNNIRQKSRYKGKIFGYHLGISKGIGTEVGFAREVSKMNDLDLIIEDRNIDDFDIANFTSMPTIIRESVLFKNSIDKINEFKNNHKIRLSFSGQGGDITLNESYRIYKRYGIFRKRYKRNYFREALYQHKNYWKYVSSERQWKKRKNIYQYIKKLFMIEYPEWLKFNEREFTTQFNKQYSQYGCFKKCNPLFLDYYLDLDSFSDLQQSNLKRFPLLDINLIINSIYLDLRNLKKTPEYRGYYKNIFCDLLPKIILDRKGKSRVDAKVLEKLTNNKEVINKNIESFSHQYSFIDKEGLSDYFVDILSGSANLSVFIRLLTIFKAYE